MTDKPTRGGRRPGAGRPASGRETYVLRLRTDTISNLNAHCSQRIEQAELIDTLVAKWVKRLNKSSSAKD